MQDDIEKSLDSNKREIGKKNSKTDKANADKYLKEIKGFETDRVALAKQSAKTAWIAVAAVLTLTPLKTVEPYLLKADSSTGRVEIVQPLSDAKGVSYDEVLDKYWLSQFTIFRNGYEWETVQNSFNTVKIMSSSKVFGAYSNYIIGEKSPTELFADKNAIKVSIEGITFLPETSKEQVLAQVQFTREIISRSGTSATGYDKTHWNATVTFDYQAEIKTEAERMVNPLGFRATSYREDRILKK